MKNKNIVEQKIQRSLILNTTHILYGNHDRYENKIKIQSTQIQIRKHAILQGYKSVYTDTPLISTIVMVFTNSIIT